MCIRDSINTRVIWLMVGAINTISPFSDVRRYRAELGLQTPFPIMEILSPSVAASIPTFYTWDPTLWPPPSDFSPHWTSTGYFETKAGLLAQSKQWLQTRNGNRRPLVYFALGSFVGRNTTALTDILFDTIDTEGIDVVTLEPTVDHRRRPEMLVASEVTHEWLFPQCAVVVHHGGAGTASQAIRSGSPSVCMPAMHFQATWCSRMEQHGAAVMIRQTDLFRAWRSGRNTLTEAIRKARLPSVAERAKVLGDAARNTGGVELASDKIEDYLRRYA
eukprot:TRINITY_DN55328_c0_g1_i2.p1 TRINITY_DN55328_c0_g1~~TRINITY_DN55328_c0_g1_i2.p1  ORF type:complete len:275 (+),score=39.84 TRINITY_DN55328_c0_g1_i2:165-989(+)